jgi:hypothetical protein
MSVPESPTGNQPLPPLLTPALRWKKGDNRFTIANFAGNANAGRASEPAGMPYAGWATDNPSSRNHERNPMTLYESHATRHPGMLLAGFQISKNPGFPPEARGNDDLRLSCLVMTALGH